MNTNEATNLIKQMVPGLVKTALNQYFSNLSTKEESQWSKNEGSFAKATKMGITDGTSPGMYITREQGIAMMSRLDEKVGFGVLNEKED